ncbi:DUF1697 domain-containing protein [Xanthobacter sp. V4C-4]|uniref:DUF1697 domain-containing protein n=1 Tax=Xanthobacter cornucopiae TaxID=3119924 RepID=UPI00372C89C4
MSRRIALLRAVNVGGTKALPMARLREVAAGLGLGAPQTVLQSGNLVFEGGDAGEAELEARLERALAAEAGLATAVLVRDAPAWARLIADNPLAEAAAAAPARVLAVCLKGEPSDADLEQLRALRRDGEHVEGRGRVIYAGFPHGLGRSRLATALSSGRGLAGTGRNWNTVRRIAACLEGRVGDEANCPLRSGGGASTSSP